MKPRIRRVFGGEKLGIYWACQHPSIDWVDGLGATPEDAWKNWERMTWNRACISLMIDTIGYPR